MIRVTWLAAIAVHSISALANAGDTIDANVSVIVTDRPDGPFETIDGSSRIGFIMARFEEGQVLFHACDGNAFRMNRDELRATEIPCDEEPSTPPGRSWAWTTDPAIMVDIINLPANQVSLVDCGTLPAHISTAFADAADGIALAGFVYEPSMESGMAMLKPAANEPREIVVRRCSPSDRVTALSLTKEEAEKWLGQEVDSPFVAVFPNR